MVGSPLTGMNLVESVETCARPRLSRDSRMQTGSYDKQDAIWLHPVDPNNRRISATSYELGEGETKIYRATAEFVRPEMIRPGPGHLRLPGQAEK